MTPGRDHHARQIRAAGGGLLLAMTFPILASPAAAPQASLTSHAPRPSSSQARIADTHTPPRAARPLPRPPVRNTRRPMRTRARLCVGHAARRSRIWIAVAIPQDAGVLRPEDLRYWGGGARQAGSLLRARPAAVCEAGPRTLRRTRTATTLDAAHNALPASHTDDAIAVPPPGAAAGMPSKADPAIGGVPPAIAGRTSCQSGLANST